MKNPAFRSSWRLVVSSLASGAIALTACTTGGDAPGTTSGTLTDEPTRAQAVAEDRPPITMAISTFGNDSFDPAMEANTTMRGVKLQMWDTLLEMGPDGEIIPGVAESWSQSDDGLSWTFELREGIQFHDGAGELTAEDVKFSIERFANEEAASGESSQVREQVQSVSVIDDYTIEIVTDGIQVDLPLLFSPHQSAAGVILPQEYMLEEGGESFQEQTDLLDRAPKGSGPFRFVARERGESMTFESIEEHWRQTASIGRLEILLVPEPATQTAMLETGEVDIVAVTGDQVGTVEEAGYDVRRIPRAAEVGLLFPGYYRDPAEGKPASDVDVRRALSLAIDRETILDTLIGGYGSLSTTPWNTSSATKDIDESYFAEWAEENNQYDPEQARSLLSEAGYPDGFDDIQLFSFTRPEVPFLPDIVELVAAYWSEIGVNAEIVSTDFASYRPHVVRPEPDDAFNAGDSNLQTATPRFNAIGALNTYVRYDGGVTQYVRDPQIDRLIDEAASEVDDSSRMELVHTAYDRFNSEYAIPMLFDLDVMFAVNPAVVGDWTTYPSYPFLSRTFATIRPPD